MKDNQKATVGLIVLAMFVGSLMSSLIMLSFSIPQTSSIKQRAIDSGHAIYHPETGEFIFKGEIVEEN